MKCPKCGFIQDEGPECASCGVVLAKYRGPAGGSAQARAASGAQIQGGAAQPSRPGAASDAYAGAAQSQGGAVQPSRPGAASDAYAGAAQSQAGSGIRAAGEAADPYLAPIRPALRVVRTLAGLAVTGLGGWLFLGQDMVLAPAQVLYLIAFSCVGLFWLLSGTFVVTVRQFVLEMLLLVCATILLYVTLPEAFDPGKLSNTTSGPMYGGEVNIPEEDRPRGR